ncbi:MAG: L-rhamnose mutarotase [Sphingobacteriales bacterium]
MQKFCLTLDLKDDPQLIGEYIEYHKNVWPEILSGITSSGINHMEIYCLGTRLFMIIEADDEFSFEKKATLDQSNQKAQDWETLMWKYQQSLFGSKPGEKWMMMERIFTL